MSAFIKAKAAMSKQQLREYELQKVFIFARTGDAELSISLAVERAISIVDAPVTKK